MKDPIVEEIRQFRDEHAKRFNYNLDAICEDFKSHQIQFGNRLVRLKAKRTGTPKPTYGHASKRTSP